MSDKVQKIKEEIERRIESMNSCPFKTAELGSEKFDNGELYAYKQILQFIDSLPEEPTIKGITWEDVNTLESLIYQVHNEYPSIGEKSFGLEVLERFQDCQDDIEESEIEDLEEELNNWRHNHFHGRRDKDASGEYLERKSQLDLARHFAEWQKQKDEQDFMKKACEYLEQEHEDIGIRYIRGVSVDEEIKLFKQYIENDSK